MSKPHLSEKSDVWKNFLLVHVLEKRHDAHDSAFFDFYVLWMGLRVGSVKELRKISGRVGSGYAFPGRIGSGRKIWTRVQL